MGRKNRRRAKHKPLLPVLPMEQVRIVPKIRCSYCGRELHPGEWHWMRDEFGQRVKKCNNEHACASRRVATADEAFRDAMRR